MQFRLVQTGHFLLIFVSCGTKLLLLMVYDLLWILEIWTLLKISENYPKTFKDFPTILGASQIFPTVSRRLPKITRCLDRTNFYVTVISSNRMFPHKMYNDSHDVGPSPTHILTGKDRVSLVQIIYTCTVSTLSVFSVNVFWMKIWNL